MGNIYTAMQNELEVDEVVIARELVKQRMVPLWGEIDGEMSSGIQNTLLALDHRAVAPITLLIDSAGGDGVNAWEIAGMIQNIRSPVTGLVVGRCAIMAFDVLIACEKRHALPQAIFLLMHTRLKFVAVLNTDTLSEADMETFRLKMTQDNRERREYYAKQLKKSPKEINELFDRGDKYRLEYTAQNALKLGLIHKVVTDFKYFGSK